MKPVDLGDYVNEQENPEDDNENIPSSGSHIKKNQIENDLW